jgi:predicted O-linked N-acetylglucosamine transferase (SPINDLY family)
MAGAHHGLAMALYRCHRIPEAIEAFGQALARDPGHSEARSYRLMALNYIDGAGRDVVYSAHAAYGACLGSARPHEFPRRGGHGGKLRIGFLSPDLRTHSVAYFLEPLLAHLPKSEFETYLYHDHFLVDSVSERLRAHASAWRHLFGVPDDGAAGAILADGIDILVDLAGHTGFNRVRLFARRLAPVQVTYLGYPNTVGIREMDYRLVDPVTDPAGDSEAYHMERLVRFAPTAWSYAPPADAPEPSPSSSAQVTFGCFSNFGKVTDRMLAAWAGILGAVPGSRLRLKTTGMDEAGVQSWATERMARAGIDPSRVELLGRTASVAEHLAHYRGVDVALDTFPYNGTTTTCEALWMGVPVVTLSGDRHASRVGASLLTAVGRTRWIAGDWDGFVALAAAVAADRAGRARHPGALREDMRASVLLDHRGQAERFGRTLRRCWESWQGQGLAAA